MNVWEDIKDTLQHAFSQGNVEMADVLELAKADD